MARRNAPGGGKPHVAVAVGGAAIWLILGGIQVFDLVQAWNRSIDELRRTAASLALVVEQDVTRGIQGIDLSLLGVADAFTYAPELRDRPQQLGQLLRVKLDRLPYVRSLTVADRNGDVIESAPAPIRAPVTERDFFAFHRDRADPDFAIHDPRTSPVTGTPYVPITRRLADRNNAFAGIVMAALEPRALADIYSSVEVGPKGTLSILKTNGLMLARFPAQAGTIGRSFADTPLFLEHLPKATAGVFVGGSNVDGVQRMVAYRKLAAFPLVVAVGMDMSRLSATWLDHARSAVIGFVLTAGLLGIATVMLARAMRDQERLVAQARQSEDRFRGFADVASDWIWEMDADLRFTYVSPGREAAMGQPPTNLYGKTRRDFIPPEVYRADPERFDRHLRALEAHEPFRNFEFWSGLPGTDLRYISVSGQPIFDAEGRFQGYRGSTTDLTNQKLAERRAAEALGRLKDAIESMSDAFALFDRDDRLVLWNKAFAAYYLDPAFVRAGRPFVDFARYGAERMRMPQPLGATPEEWLAERLRRHQSPGEPIELLRHDGRWDRIAESRSHDGGTVLVRSDITELKRREQALERLARQQRALAELSQLALRAPALPAIMQRAADLLAACLDVPRAAIGEFVQERRQVVLRAGVGWPESAIGATQRTAEFDDGRGLSAVILGSPMPFGLVVASGDPGRAFEPDERGFVDAVASALSVAIDRWSAARARQLHEARLAGILNAIPASIALLDRTGVVVEVNRRWSASQQGAALFGAAFPVGTNYISACRAVGGALADAGDVIANGLGLVLGGKSPASAPVEYACEGGPRRLWFRAMICALSSDPEEGAVIMHIDVTDRRQSEATLAQAQKLEAVGHLTGGIAHDFNNLLTVILGQSDILGQELAHNAEYRQMAETINAAAQRGADLTRQMLAFARRQTLQPGRVDVNALIEGMLPILRRTLSATIEIKTVLAADIWPCLADHGQLEAALLNLAINARDAMPRGGVLTIETDRVVLDEHYAVLNPDAAPGAYVMIGVSDTGHGMSAEIVRQAFEPFFTTKPVGQGTGLGLSMVYGFAKQTGGHVKIYSEVGSGTSVKIYLPRTDPSAQPDRQAAPRAERTARGAETILLVEDDAMVRDFAAQHLRRLGYRVVEAANGSAAMGELQNHEDIDLVFSDVIMPGGMTGQELANAARKLRPRLKILLTSGYPAGALSTNGQRDASFELIHKPYQVDDLAERIRRLLDQG